MHFIWNHFVYLSIFSCIIGDRLTRSASTFMHTLVWGYITAIPPFSSKAVTHVFCILSVLAMHAWVSVNRRKHTYMVTYGRKKTEKYNQIEWKWSLSRGWINSGGNEANWGLQTGFVDWLWPAFWIWLPVILWEGSMKSGVGEDGVLLQFLSGWRFLLYDCA